MTPEQAEKSFSHPLLKAVMAIGGEWFKDEARVTFHDPISAVCIFHDDVCTFTEGEISIELDSPVLSGFTYWSPRPGGEHQVAMEINEQKFFEHLLSVFN